MTDVTKLKQEIDNSGLKLDYIAKHLGITRQTLSKKLKGQAEFKQSEMVILSYLLNLSPTEREFIFFKP